MKKVRTIVVMSLLLMVSFMLLAQTAFAHVVVYPREASQGSYEKFTMRVPTEKDSPTVSVELVIPDGVSISRVEPKPDWAYEMVKDDTGKISRIVWTATGPGLSATEFGEFHMQGRVADDAAELVWKAYQTYGDGDRVDWVGASDSERPASVTMVKAKGAAAAADQSGSGVDAALIVSIIALVISLLAFVFALRGRTQSRKSS